MPYIRLEISRKIFKKTILKIIFDFQIISLQEREKISAISQKTSKSVRALSMRKPREMKLLLSEIWLQTKLLCKPPHLRNTILTCAIQFGLTTRWINYKYFLSNFVRLTNYIPIHYSYYTLMIWFPELFYRFEEFEGAHPGQHASVCEVSSIILTNG